MARLLSMKCPAVWAKIHGGRATAATCRRLALGFCACVLLIPFASSQEATQPQGAAPLAVFAGQPIDESQLPPAAKRQLENMEEQVFAVRRRALQMVLDQKLVEAEARKKGVTVDELFKDEVESKVAEPTDDEVAAYYELHKGQINKPIDEARESIRRDLKAAAVDKARQHYLWALMEKAVNDGQLNVLLLPPKLMLPVDPTRVKGDPKAPVTIIEFSDFSCASCAKAESTINELMAKHPGKIKLSFHDFPLTAMHPDATAAAEASRCAGEQSKFWEYHDLLFSNPARQGRDNLVDYARSLKLDDKQFDTCLSSGKYDQPVDEDFQLGLRAGVVAAPGFFVDGMFADGAQSADALEKIVEQELSREQSDLSH
jgi:protein-disulfide isomerase